jgi:transposase
MNFFQYRFYLEVKVPRVDGGKDHKIAQVEVPWARPGVGFTLLMEAMMMLLGQSGMAVAEAGRTLSVADNTYWHVLDFYVHQAHSKVDKKEVKKLLVDETSIRKGHDYVTVICEPSQPEKEKPTRVLFVTEGNDYKTLEATAEFLKDHGGEADQIQMVCSDMSSAFKKGFNQYFPKAIQVTDYFHVVQKLTKAVNNVRLRENKKVPELLKRTRFLWIKKESKLNQSQKEKLHRLCGYKLQTAKAQMILAAFQDLLMAKDFDEALGGLRWWYFCATHSRIPEIIQAAKNLKANCWDGLINYLKYRLTNAAAEAMNGLIQVAKRKARGFRNFSYFRIAIYLIGACLKFNLPTPIPAYPVKT